LRRAISSAADKGMRIARTIRSFSRKRFRSAVALPSCGLTSFT
jgi:hypothetical protein